MPTAKPPIFSVPLTGSKAQQYLHRARMFRAAAIELVDYVGPEQNWPKYALLTHAIELALKAFADHAESSGTPPGKEPKQHDLTGWYQLALSYGLPPAPGVADHIEILNELHRTHYSRYPQQSARPIPGAQDLADSTVDHLITTISAVVYGR